MKLLAMKGVHAKLSSYFSSPNVCVAGTSRAENRRDLSSLVVDLTYQEGIQRDILEYER